MFVKTQELQEKQSLNIAPRSNDQNLVPEEHTAQNSVPVVHTAQNLVTEGVDSQNSILNSHLFSGIDSENEETAYLLGPNPPHRASHLRVEGTFCSAQESSQGYLHQHSCVHHVDKVQVLLRPLQHVSDTQV